jgi:hypothetical protein
MLYSSYEYTGTVGFIPILFGRRVTPAMGIRNLYVLSEKQKDRGIDRLPLASILFLFFSDGDDACH